MSELEISITKLLMEIKDEGKGTNSGGLLMELRDHLIELYNKIGVGLLKRHMHYDE